MKKIITAILILFCLCTSGCKDTSTLQNELPVIGVLQLMEHTSLNQIYNSMIDELSALGYEDGKNCIIDYKNAQGERTNIMSIVQIFEGSLPDVVVAIATPSAQGAMSLTDKIPVIFSAVTDPIEAGLMSSLDAPDHNMTGTSDAVQVDQIIELALEIQPEAKTVGYLYNPGEANSVSNFKLLKDVCAKKNLSLVESGISSSADLSTAASILCDQVDFIFVANDNTVAAAMPALAQIAIEKKIPVYTGADSMVLDGGFATKGIDYTDLGKETAHMIQEVLNGKTPSEIPVKVFKDDLFIYVNKNTATQLGITLPESVISSDKYIEVGE